MANTPPDFMLNIRNSLSNSAAFRTWSGTADQAAAEAVCHIQQEPATLEDKFVLIFMEDGDPYKRERVSTGGYLDGGEFRLLFEGADPTGEDDGDKYLKEFQNIMDIMSDVEDDSENAARLRVNSWEITNGPSAPARNEKGGGITRWQTFVLVTWGRE